MPPVIIAIGATLLARASRQAYRCSPDSVAPRYAVTPSFGNRNCPDARTGKRKQQKSAIEDAGDRIHASAEAEVSRLLVWPERFGNVPVQDRSPDKTTISTPGGPR